MLRSPPDDHDDHLRYLLDQRSARADVNGRFSSISEYSDTPSVYSRPYFSPNPSNNADHHTRNDEHFHDPGSSMLDLDDDPRSSFAPSETYEDETLEDGEDGAPVARLSYLGPKMRFHSRAPWEMEDDALEEEDEIDENPRHFTSAFPFARANGSRPNNSGSSSPRPSYATSRPSGESSRSQVPPKRSFETINSQISYPRGALYALAQESMSATSLGRMVPTPQKEKLRNKFSLGRLRPETPGSTPLPPMPVSPAHGHFPPSILDTSVRSGADIASTSRNHSASMQESMHPYANPDLVVSYAEDRLPHYTHSSVSHYTPPRNDSNMTVTESFSTDSMMKSTIQAKNISSPVTVIGPPQRTELSASDSRQDHSANGLPPGVTTLPGWTERTVAPTFSLISLEEARAQRMRSTTSNEASRASTSSGASNLSAFPSGEREASNVAEGSNASALGNLTSRARGRSISAGTKARNTLQTIVGQPKMERRDSEPAVVVQPSANGTSAGKSLKHKKSGFMRLFNGNKVQEKDERDALPPVPTLPENFNNYQPVQRTPKSSVHRIAVPSLSHSMFDAAAARSSDTLLSESPSWKTSPLSPKRTPPTLSINTVPQGSSSRASVSAVVDRNDQTRLGPSDRPWLNDQQPQSAPPNVTEFPTLRLRPMSTLFSAHFSDHIVTADSRSSGETSDSDTPRSSSPSGLMSPITPGSGTRTSNDQMELTPASDDQSAVKTLQEQLITAKKAWQRHIWELEGQIRDLKTELEETKGKYGDDYCSTCGRGKKAEVPISTPVGGGVVNRPRARTGTSSRFGNALP
ncbi:hypothetical protein BDZ97DRAFT_1751829 [Flammula alnicola]|nr:hypothetical protein BDZ97DRAFT_1751829 [Flammula alnicola]